LDPNLALENSLLDQAQKLAFWMQVGVKMQFESNQQSKLHFGHQWVFETLVDRIASKLLLDANLTET